MRKFKWHIFLATLDPVVGSEQGKTRPVLIISDEEINQILPVVNVRQCPRIRYLIND
jgi:mRNA interferase MazF